ncbi:CarboxypepD_reg-like domain-containing protein [Flavobacterium swingsii]|jgi:hypothetical protein|uniref:CarboxypepD_reg-like domain-containing protein n=1 Tax=Flavobacterium swingsii TaxID=498292 RepID=A0A1I0WDQ0_9FLAO|nr:carboxypeptidase-like regulatory domain-containing protein [Flavobacterium swingsii]SFA86036.1 CarboxypepD_reg-like domain-containing protein [Flavobacterium swingsii]
MKRKLLIVFFLFLIQTVFSQTGRLVYGKVVNNEKPINGIEVINLSTKNSTITNKEGRFSITGNPKDVLVFISKNYEPKKVFLDQKNIGNIGFTISLVQKIEQLEEVVITMDTKPQFNSQKIVDGKYFDDAQSSPKNRYVYDGSIENGIDFVRLYKEVSKKIKE